MNLQIITNYNDNNPFKIYEEWRPITEQICNKILPYYHISILGRIYSIRSNKILEISNSDKGYGLVNLSLSGGLNRTYFIHRLVLKTFTPIENDELFQVNHKDGNKKNNIIYNLEWCTSKENIYHARQNGYYGSYAGENNPSAKITVEQAEQIAQLLMVDIKYTYKQIAEMVGGKCTENVVANIARGKTWYEVYNKYNLSERSKSTNITLTNDQLHSICKYLENNKEIKLNLLFSKIAEELNIECDNSFKDKLYRLYKRESFIHISRLYNF